MNSIRIKFNEFESAQLPQNLKAEAPSTHTGAISSIALNSLRKGKEPIETPVKLSSENLRKKVTLKKIVVGIISLVALSVLAYCFTVSRNSGGMNSRPFENKNFSTAIAPYSPPSDSDIERARFLRGTLLPHEREIVIKRIMEEWLEQRMQEYQTELEKVNRVEERLTKLTQDHNRFKEEFVSVVNQLNYPPVLPST